MYEKNVERIEELVRQQNKWRWSTLNLIASENVLSRKARAVMGSDFAHRYAEGHPGERYYQGTEKIDEIETRCEKHLKTLFECRNIDVRPISGTVANDAVFSRYIDYGNVVMVNSTAGGGHISHHRAGSVGKYTDNIINFPLTEDGYHIDVDHTVDLIESLHPKVLILGKSMILFPEPVKQLAPICKEKGITLIYDGAHVLGLIGGNRFQHPLKDGADIVTGSTHKTFFGAQRGIVFSNMKDSDWARVDKGAFPGSSSNHHLDTLVALAITAYEFLEFGEAYADQVIKNAKALAKALYSHGFDVQAEKFGFTECHQVVLNVKKLGGGDEVARILKDNNVIANMNLLPFEPLEKVQNPAGLRLGVQEMTRIGMKEDEMQTIADLFKKCLIDGDYIGDEVKDFRKDYQIVHYSFDEGAEPADKHANLSAVK
ncbi:MAG: serine hydroxymethyltransferase [bacterium]